MKQVNDPALAIGKWGNHLRSNHRLKYTESDGAVCLATRLNFHNEYLQRILPPRHFPFLE